MAIDIHSRKREGRRFTQLDGRYVGVAVVIAVAFFVSFAYASSSRTATSPAWAGNSASGTYAVNGGTSGGGAGGCCGGGGGATGATGGASGAAGAVSAVAGAVTGGGGGGCCGGGGPQTTVPGSTTVSGGVQKVTIDLTTGSYSPNEITAKAGVPLELDFKGPANGCNGYVQSQQLGFSQDMSGGGTIKVDALQPGTYTFACSMNMYTAKIIVK